jgi:hypothetical protein
MSHPERVAADRHSLTMTLFLERTTTGNDRQLILHLRFPTLLQWKLDQQIRKFRFSRNIFQTLPHHFLNGH